MEITAEGEDFEVNEEQKRLQKKMRRGIWDTTPTANSTEDAAPDVQKMWIHKPQQCPAYGQQCKKYERYNHFAKVCRNKKQVNSLTDKSKDSDQIYMQGKINISERETEAWLETVNFPNTGKILIFKLDSGAKCNVISKKDFNKIESKEKAGKLRSKLSNYNGTEIPISGKVILNCQIKNKINRIEFFVTESNQTSPILGLPTIQKLKLLTRINLINKKDIERKNFRRNRENILWI